MVWGCSDCRPGKTSRKLLLFSSRPGRSWRYVLVECTTRPLWRQSGRSDGVLGAPSPHTVQGSHSPHCPTSPHFPSPLTQDPSLGPNPYPSPPYIPQPYILLEWGGSDVTTGSVVRVGGSEGAGEPDTSGCDVTSAPF